MVMVNGRAGVDDRYPSRRPPFRHRGMWSRDVVCPATSSSAASKIIKPISWPKRQSRYESGFRMCGGGAPLLSGDLSSPCGRKCRRRRRLVCSLPGWADGLTHRVQENIYVRAAKRLCRVAKHTPAVVPIGKWEQGKRGRSKGKKNESNDARTRSTSAKASATDFTLSMLALRDEGRGQARLPNL
jgi:hypothetical protein